MSAFGYKRTYSGQLANVRFTPESGHSEAACLHHQRATPRSDTPADVAEDENEEEEA